MKKGILLTTIIILLALPLIQAQPATVQTSINLEVGIEIVVPPIPVYQEDEAFTFHFHIFNKSSGRRLLNDSTSCLFHLYNKTGDHIYENKNIDFSSNSVDFEVMITSNNFSESGHYAYEVQCNTSEIEGFEAVHILITPTGTILTESEAVVYGISFFVMAVIFFLSLYYFVVIPWSHTRNREGEIIGINDLKYFKLILGFITYLVLLFIFSIAHNLTQSYLVMQGLATFFRVGYFILLSGLAPVFFVFLVLLLISIVNGRTLKKMLDRNFHLK